MDNLEEIFFLILKYCFQKSNFKTTYMRAKGLQVYIASILRLFLY